MPNELILAPVLAHFFLVLTVYIMLFFRKMSALKRGAVELKDTALNSKAWNDDEVLKVSNNLDNQFQAPVLFYAVSFVLYSLAAVNTYTLVLAWLFVLSRYAHTFIHTGSNHIPSRMKAFSLGMVSLVLMALYASFTLWPTL